MCRVILQNHFFYRWKILHHGGKNEWKQCNACDKICNTASILKFQKIFASNFIICLIISAWCILHLKCYKKILWEDSFVLKQWSSNFTIAILHRDEEFSTGKKMVLQNYAAHDVEVLFWRVKKPTFFLSIQVLARI